MSRDDKNHTYSGTFNLQLNGNYETILSAHTYSRMRLYGNHLFTLGFSSTLPYKGEQERTPVLGLRPSVSAQCRLQFKKKICRALLTT